MDDFNTESGEVFEGSIQTINHRHSYRIGRVPFNEVAVVSEIVHDRFTLLAVAGVAGSAASQLLAAIAAKRVSEGYNLVGITNSSAHLVKGGVQALGGFQRVGVGGIGTSF